MIFDYVNYHKYHLMLLNPVNNKFRARKPSHLSITSIIVYNIAEIVIQQQLFGLSNESEITEFDFLQKKTESHVDNRRFNERIQAFTVSNA